MSKDKILMWGEFPPNTHTGISVSNEYIYQVLNSESYSIIKVEENTWNKILFGRIKNITKNYLNIINAVFNNNIRILYFNLPLSKIGLCKLIIILPLIKLFSCRTNFIGHLHRGDFNQFIEKNILHRYLFRIAGFFINEIIVLSPLFEGGVKVYFKKKKIHVLHNTSVFESNIVNTRKNYDRKYLCISNYIRTKGLKEIVECFRFSEISEFKLSIYGHIYDTLFYNEIKEIASNNIDFNTGLDREGIRNILNNYDCLVIPSWNEGQPIIILEAMSLGIPIISTSVGDIPNMLGDDYEFLASPQNVESLFDAVIKFDKSDKKTEISEYLLKRYQSYYSNANYKLKLLEIFKI